MNSGDYNMNGTCSIAITEGELHGYWVKVIWPNVTDNDSCKAHYNTKEAALAAAEVLFTTAKNVREIVLSGESWEAE